MKYRYREPHEMKDSGVEWLGMIPKEWKNNKFSRIFKEFSGQGFPIELQGEMKGVPFFKVSDINLNEKYVETANNYVSTEIISIKKWNIIPRNTIVLAKIGEALRKNHRKILKVDGLIDNNLVGLFCKEWDTNYSYYYFKCINMEWYLNPGAVPSINMNFLRESILANPDILEQQKIADFLDKKCEEFDSVIAKKEILINKLEEAKKSLISEVITGKVKVIEKENGEYGIIKREANEMKDSGVEWLGMIPKEWSISRLKHLANLGDKTLSEKEDENLEIKYLDIGNVNSKGEILEWQDFKFKDAPSRARRILVEKDIIVSTVRTYLRAMAYITNIQENAICSTGFAILKARKDKIINKYLYYIVFSNMFVEEVVRNSTGVSYPAITSAKIMDLKVSYSLIKDEQRKIVDFLNLKCFQFDSIIEKQKELIEKLKSAKQSLISEAVTGKIEIL